MAGEINKKLIKETANRPFTGRGVVAASNLEKYLGSVGHRNDVGL